jgi:NAD(P)-dependent dehydrogenase (short-subunit alcohol dehydrogenase family)
VPGIDEGDLSDRTIVITGGNAGIGREAAVTLARRGATVVITARDEAKGRDALDHVRSRSRSDRVEVASLDLASFASIRAFAESFLATHDRLDVLVNNAGGIISERRLTEDGFEMTFGVNHLGHFLLTALLRDRLQDSAPSRVVTVASIGHRLGTMHWPDLQYERGYVGTVAYNQSKLANVLFAQGLARRLEGTGVTATCCHPGPVRTGFGAHGDTQGFERFFLTIARPFEITPRWGSRVLVHLAAAPSGAEDAGGYYVGGYLGRAARHRPSRAARDPVSAERLWAISEQLVESVPA